MVSVNIQKNNGQLFPIFDKIQTAFAEYTSLHTRETEYETHLEIMDHINMFNRLIKRIKTDNKTIIDLTEEIPEPPQLTRNNNIHLNTIKNYYKPIPAKKRQTAIEHSNDKQVKKSTTRNLRRSMRIRNKTKQTLDGMGAGSGATGGDACKDAGACSESGMKNIKKDLLSGKFNTNSLQIKKRQMAKLTGLGNLNINDIYNYLKKHPTSTPNGKNIIITFIEFKNIFVKLGNVNRTTQTIPLYINFINSIWNQFGTIKGNKTRTFNIIDLISGLSIIIFEYNDTKIRSIFNLIGNYAYTINYIQLKTYITQVFNMIYIIDDSIQYVKGTNANLLAKVTTDSFLNSDTSNMTFEQFEQIYNNNN